MRRGYIERVGFGIDETLDLDRVLPAIAEVIKIVERFDARIFQNVDEFRPAGVERAVGPVWVGQAPSGAAGADLIKMTVGPAERGLRGQVQAVELYRERNLDATQNFRLRVVEGDFEANDRIGGHATSLRPSRAAAQRLGSWPATSAEPPSLAPSHSTG